MANIDGGISMKFCPKCKSIMMPKVVGEKKQLVCGCGYKESTEGITISEAIKKPEEIAVVENETSINVIIDAECPKCGHRKAEYWEVQTRSSDEPPTRFHKCIKCRSTWREYT